MSSKKIFNFCLILAGIEVLVPSAARAQIILAGKSANDIVLDILKFLLSIAGSITLLMLIISGISYIISRGDPEAKKKAGKNLVSATAGLFLVMISYALIVVLNQIFAKP